MGDLRCQQWHRWGGIHVYPIDQIVCASVFELGDDLIDVALHLSITGHTSTFQCRRDALQRILDMLEIPNPYVS